MREEAIELRRRGGYQSRTLERRDRRSHGHGLCHPQHDSGRASATTPARCASPAPPPTVVIGTLVLAAAAHVRIPFIPVPATLQSLAVALIAAAFGARLGVATVALYIAEGLSGLPVFTNGGGSAYVLSPTFGFIVGWLPMAFDRRRSPPIAAVAAHPAAVAVMMVGDAVSFVFGYFWLVALSGGANWIDRPTCSARPSISPSNLSSSGTGSRWRWPPSPSRGPGSCSGAAGPDLCKPCLFRKGRPMRRPFH